MDDSSSTSSQKLCAEETHQLPRKKFSPYLLKNLPPRTTRIPFQTAKDVIKELDRRQARLRLDLCRNQYLVFTNVPEKSFDDVVDYDSHVGDLAHVSGYDPRSGFLVFKLRAHVESLQLVRQLELLLVIKTFQMGLKESIVPLGPAMFKLGADDSASIWKEADGAWEPLGKKFKLTMVIEAGFSYATKRLAFDAKSWIEAEGSTVQLALTIEIDDDPPRVTYRCWERPLSSKPSQEVRVLRKGSETVVEGDFLLLPFEKLHARSKASKKPTGKDIILTPTDFKKMTADIWKLIDNRKINRQALKKRSRR
jgi:hypothetical protein